jgi:hypothetical protein
MGVGGAWWLGRFSVPRSRNGEWSVTKVWNESIVDYSARNIGAFNQTADSLTEKLQKRFSSRIDRVLIVPTTSGYDVFVFAERDIIAAQSFVAANFDAELETSYRALSKWSEDAKNLPNKAPQSTTTAGPPTAGQEARQP